jgi:hypothetical protein
MVIYTKTPGWNAQIYATNTAPVFTPAGAPGTPTGSWQLVGSASNVQSPQTVTLSSSTTVYRYWLVWITSLGGHQQIALNEVELYK